MVLRQSITNGDDDARCLSRDERARSGTEGCGSRATSLCCCKEAANGRRRAFMVVCGNAVTSCHSQFPRFLVRPTKYAAFASQL
ncbi:hypothetical protein BHM03_00055004 [Ensete ventricosum]|nr:hypothetical protein BHM03_00055004 [Ensete ventricosum]